MSGVDDKKWSWNLINADSPEHVCNVLYAIASEAGIEFWPEEGVRSSRNAARNRCRHRA